MKYFSFFLTSILVLQSADALDESLRKHVLKERAGISEESLRQERERVRLERQAERQRVEKANAAFAYFFENSEQDQRPAVQQLVENFRVLLEHDAALSLAAHEGRASDARSRLEYLLANPTPAFVGQQEFVQDVLQGILAYHEEALDLQRRHRQMHKRRQPGSGVQPLQQRQNFEEADNPNPFKREKRRGAHS